MKREQGERVFEDLVRFRILPFKGFDKLPTNDTTPSVENLENWIANNAGAVTVTAFDNGAEGQTINVLGDGFTTVSHNAVIKTNTGANKLLAVNRIYTFTFINNIWYEHG